MIFQGLDSHNLQYPSHIDIESLSEYLAPDAIRSLELSMLGRNQYKMERDFLESSNMNKTTHPEISVVN
ncbi:hypothetical protein FRX31_007136 [Thalictrum thalictroides]|uniref:Uncharacterized protein n=1 Tax=Thalictrum thalictroides TaxID=46969 RepID=A0A7J6X2G3_THATH|nr:hypothetical protein FRX31_007136 [Thalictrum thalictroides]